MLSMLSSLIIFMYQTSLYNYFHQIYFSFRSFAHLTMDILNDYFRQSLNWVFSVENETDFLHQLEFLLLSLSSVYFLICQKQFDLYVLLTCLLVFILANSQILKCFFSIHFAPLEFVNEITLTECQNFFSLIWNYSMAHFESSYWMRASFCFSGSIHLYIDFSKINRIHDHWAVISEQRICFLKELKEHEHNLAVILIKVFDWVNFF